MSNAMVYAVQSMQRDMQTLDVLSHNAANTTTVGFKRQIASPAFAQHIQNEGHAETSTSSNRVDSLPLFDFTAGSLRKTGNPLDLAIIGTGFFELQTAHGPRYSRAGNFHLDAQKRLVNSEGFAVQSDNGDVVLAGDQFDIGADGQIKVDGRVLGRLKVLEFAVLSQLRKQDNGLFVATDAAQAKPARVELQVGHLENANSQSVREMLNLMETMRHFEANQKIVQGYGDMVSMAVQKIGEF